MAPPSKRAKTSKGSASAPAAASAAPSTSTANPTGDDLDDNFLLDDEFADEGGRASDFEADDGAAGALLSDDPGADLGGGSDSEDGERGKQAPAPAQQATKKRAATADELGDEAGAAAEGARPLSKRQAKKANQRKRTKVSEDQSGDEQQHAGMGLLPPEALADRLAEKQRKALPNLSALEMDEQRISGAYDLSRARFDSC